MGQSSSRPIPPRSTLLIPTLRSQIPLPLLHSVTRLSPNLPGTEHPLILRTRDYLVYELLFSAAEDADGVCDSLKGICAGVGSAGIDGLFAFFYQGEEPCEKGREGGESGKDKGKGRDQLAGWGIYDPKKEFERMGVGSRSKTWRFSTVNADYEVRCVLVSRFWGSKLMVRSIHIQFCPSYPAQIVVPSKISDSTLRYAVKYRSKGRIPGLVYLHWANLVCSSSINSFLFNMTD